MPPTEQYKRKSWTRLSFRHPQTTAELLARDQAASHRAYRSGLTLLFATLISVVIGIGTDAAASDWPPIFGAVFLIHLALYVLINQYHREVLAGVRSFLQLFMLVGVFMAACVGLEISNTISPYLMPLPVLAMTLALIYSSMLAIHVTLGVAVLIAMLTAPGAGDLREQIALVAALSFGSVVGVIGVQRIRTRSRLVLVGLASGAVQFVTIVALRLWNESFDWHAIGTMGDLRDLASELGRYFKEPGLGFLNGALSGIFLTSALPFIEDLFGVVTDQRLIELSDQNNPLLHQFALVAPGSWQHSLMVGQLAEEAALSIGANDLLARVSAYYHDIGKMLKPNYFTENMKGEENPHDRLSPEMSRLIIISHVKDGIAILKEEGLPRPIIDIVPMHHGTTVVEYFYHKKKMQDDEERKERTERGVFQYPGPTPTFPEAGILMLADSTEAIARTLSDPTPARLRNLVRGVIEKRMSEGQLDECDLTLRDLRKIEDAFVRVLAGIYHQRIRYQQEVGRSDAEAGEAETRSDGGGQRGNGNGGQRTGGNSGRKGKGQGSGGKGNGGKGNGGKGNGGKGNGGKGNGGKGKSAPGAAGTREPADPQQAAPTSEDASQKRRGDTTVSTTAATSSTSQARSSGRASTS